MMKSLLDQLDHKFEGIISQSGRLASQLGARAYLVGGPVRDLILGHPNADLDITVEGDGIRLAEIFSRQHKGAKLTSYPAFKTATVNLGRTLMVDFATARKETYSKSGAFPKVTPSHIKDDLLRRDFTINAMALAINPESWGKLVDPFGGARDLKAKRIRILHEKSFWDDPTRIVRAARLKTRFGFMMERNTLNILKAAVRSGALDNIKPQRYGKEFNKVLKEKDPKQAIECLRSWDAYVSRSSNA